MSDTEVLVHLVARSKAPDVELALIDALSRVRGAYSLLALVPGRPRPKIVSSARVTRIITGRELEEQVGPAASQWLGALYTASDGRAEPHKAAPAIARAAAAKGAKILTGCAVRGLETEAGRVSAVVTEHGRIRTSTVLCAAGAWSAQVGEWAGVDLPVVPLRRQILTTEPMAGLDPHEQEAHEHDGRAGHGEDQEPGRGAAPCLGVVSVTPRVDHEPHRDERDLEEDEEQHQVEGEERAEHARLDDEEQDRERRGAPRAALGIGRRVPEQRHQCGREDQGRHQHQRRGDPVDAESPVHVERGEPHRIHRAPHATQRAVVLDREPHRPAEGDQGTDRCHRDSEPLSPCEDGGEQGEDHRGHQQAVEEDRDHETTPAATAIAHAPTTTTMR